MYYLTFNVCYKQGFRNPYFTGASASKKDFPPLVKKYFKCF